MANGNERAGTTGQGTRSIALQTEETPKALALAEMMTLAQEAVDSGMFPGLAKKAQALVKIMAGRELGMGPMASLRLIDVVLGKVRLSAEATAGLVKRSGRYDYKVVELTEQQAVLEFTDRSKSVYTSKFTLADAKMAGLLKPDSNWVKYPRSMLFSRAITQGARIVCPEVLAGAEVWEEMGYDVVEGQVVKEGEPPTGAWRAFWGEAAELGFTEGQVHQVLGVASVKEWEAAGRSLDEALAALKHERVERDIAEMTGEAAPAPDEGPVPATSKAPEGGFKATLQATAAVMQQRVDLRAILQKRWPDKPNYWEIFFRDVVGPDCTTVEEVPEALLAEVIQKATPKERPQAKKGA